MSCNASAKPELSYRVRLGGQARRRKLLYNGKTSQATLSPSGTGEASLGHSEQRTHLPC